MLDRDLCITRGVVFTVNEFSTSDDYDVEQEEFYHRTFSKERLKDVDLEGCYKKQAHAPGWCEVYGPLRRIVEICYDDGEIPEEAAKIEDEDDPWTSVQNIVQGADSILPMDIDNAPSEALDLADIDWDLKTEIDDMPYCILRWNSVYSREARMYQKLKIDVSEQNWPLLMAVILVKSPMKHERAKETVDFIQWMDRDAIEEIVKFHYND